VGGWQGTGDSGFAHDQRAHRPTTSMADTFELEIVTPEKLVVKDAAEEMQIPGKTGIWGSCRGTHPHHGAFRRADQLPQRQRDAHLGVAWGFAEVLPDKARFCREAERGEDVDCERARKAKERAQERVSSADPDWDVRGRRSSARACDPAGSRRQEGQISASH